MANRLIIDGNAVYEIDEECMRCQKRKYGRNMEADLLRKEAWELTGEEERKRKQKDEG